MDRVGLQLHLPRSKCFYYLSFVLASCSIFLILMLDFLKNISPVEIAIIALILIMLFGARVVSKLAKTSGETVKEAKKIKRSIVESLEDDGDQRATK